MGLSVDLISQFAKITKDEKKPNTESTVYGKTVDVDGTIYVQLDGSDLYTPVNTTANVKPNERVTVSIKDHAATITGSVTSPSASVSDVKDVVDQITEFEIIITNKINAETARIDTLVADNVTIKESLTVAEADIDILQAANLTVTEKLEADEAEIENLKTTKLDTSVANATFATIENLEATDAKVYNLEATYGEFVQLTTEQLNAITASINDLKANKADISALNAATAKIDTLEANKADIADLDAVEARVEVLEAGVADIDTLIFGSATGDTIQTSFSNSVIAQVGDAQIKSAMIEDVSASKITAGDINTNNVRVMSEDGRLVISDETMQISDATRVRVQIGKDSSGDYSINIWDMDGNLMFSKGGITDSAIKQAIIRNDMVSDTANIAAHKLDINSLFEEINGSTKTINSTRIYLDDEKQTLDVAFESMSSDVKELQNGVSSQGTQITAIQGQITSKVWQQDIDTATNEMSTQYSTLQQEVDSFESTVSSTYATKSEVDDLTIGGRNYFVRGNMNNLAYGSADDEHPNGRILENVYYRGFSFPVVAGEQWCLHRTDITNNRWGVYWLAEEPALDSVIMSCAFRTDNQAANVPNLLTVPAEATWGFIYLSNNVTEGDVPNIMLEKSTKPSDWRPAPEDVDNDILAVQDEVVTLEERVANAETIITQNTDAIALTATKTEVETAKSEAVVTASADAQTKANKAVSDANANTANVLKSYSTTAQMNAAITASANSITSSVKSTYATIETVEGIDIGGRNYYRPSKVVDLGCTGLASGEQSLISTGSCIGFYIPVVAGEVWSVSRSSLTNNRFDCCFTVEEPANGVLIQGWNSGYRESLEMVGLVVPEGCNYLFLYLSNQNDEMPNVKVERGNKVTDWTPAPEDMATSDELSSVQSSADLTEERVTTAETLIQQLSDSISMLVTDGNGQSLMTQTDTGWTFSTGELQSIVDSTSENLDALTNEVGDVNSAVGVLQQAVDDLGILNDYVKIGTYEDEPCIELGEMDSDFKLLITNTRIMFMEGTGVPAYINNQSLHIKKAVIEEELQQGEFVWKARNNGNLGLIWKGVTS